MAEAMKSRTNPFTAKRFNLVALWSGVLKADGGGNASFDVNIPQFSGALRVMAVAYKDNTFRFCRKANQGGRSNCDQHCHYPDSLHQMML
jgi:hypothetical protein